MGTVRDILEKKMDDEGSTVEGVDAIEAYDSWEEQSQEIKVTDKAQNEFVQIKKDCSNCINTINRKIADAEKKKADKQKQKDDKKKGDDGKKDKK